MLSFNKGFFVTIQFFKAMSTQMEQRHHRSEAFHPEGLVTVGSSPRSFLFTSADSHFRYVRGPIATKRGGKKQSDI